MTERELYENVLIERNKNFGTADLMLEDFNYYATKGIFQWVQKRYNVMETNEQVRSDLQALMVPGTLSPPSFYDIAENGKLSYTKKGALVYFKGNLPEDYLHIAGCFLELKVNSDYKCYKSNSTFEVSASNLTLKREGKMLRNSWFKPSHRNPFYKVETAGWGEAGEGKGNTPGSNLLVTIGQDVSIPKQANPITGTFSLVGIRYEYIRFPKKVDLTYAHLDSPSDTSSILEFKYDVCLEIIKEIVQLLALKTGDPILQNYAAINTTVPPQAGVTV